MSHEAIAYCWLSLQQMCDIRCWHLCRDKLVWGERAQGQNLQYVTLMCTTRIQFFKLWFCINAHAFLFSFTSIQSTWIQVKKIKLAIFNLVFQWIAYICLRQSTTVSNLHPIPISVGYMGWLGVYTHTLKSTHPFPGCIPDLWGLAEQQTIVEL